MYQAKLSDFVEDQEDFDMVRALIKAFDAQEVVITNEDGITELSWKKS